MAYLAGRRNLASLLIRTPNSSSLASSLSSRSRFVFSFLNKNPLCHLVPAPVIVPSRFKTSRAGYIVRASGLDFKHWRILMEIPTDPKPPEEEMIQAYIKALASVVGSEEEAKKKIYSVSTRAYTGFGALISEELADQLKGLPVVSNVLPDLHLDINKKDYGGDVFINGKVIHRPEYDFRLPTLEELTRKGREPMESESVGESLKEYLCRQLGAIWM